MQKGAASQSGNVHSTKIIFEQDVQAHNLPELNAAYSGAQVKAIATKSHQGHTKKKKTKQKQFKRST